MTFSNLPRNAEEARAQLFIAEEMCQALYSPGADFTYSLEPYQREQAAEYKAMLAYRAALKKMLVELFKDPETITAAEAERVRQARIYEARVAENKRLVDYCLASRGERKAVSE